MAQIDDSLLVVDGMDFEGRFSREPLQPTFSLGLLGLVLPILHVHSFAQLDVLLVLLQMLLIVLLGVAFLELRNILGRFSEGRVVNILQGVYQRLCHFCASKKVIFRTEITCKINITLLQFYRVDELPSQE